MLYQIYIQAFTLGFKRLKQAITDKISVRHRAELFEIEQLLNKNVQVKKRRKD